MTLELTRWVSLDKAKARSINLERDAGDTQFLRRFRITPLVSDVLKRLGEALEGEKINAWSLTGPYGTGKSAFCNFLLSLFCGCKEERTICHEKLLEGNLPLAGRLEPFVALNSTEPKFMEVRALSRYEPLNTTLARGLLHSVEKELALEHEEKRMKRLADIRESLTGLSEQDWPPTSLVTDAYREVAETGGRPIFLVVDEFGKNLEFQAHNPGKGDIYALQMLAEAGAIFVWVCLHQAFSVYSNVLSKLQRKEWQKVQGRFEDIPYVEPSAGIFPFIRDSISANPPDARTRLELQQWADSILKTQGLRNIPGLESFDREDLLSLYPFHPLTALLLGEMARRFGQNDRTLYTFLTSGEPGALPAWLRRAVSPGKADKLPTLGLDSLFDYFCQDGMPRYGDKAQSQRWLEIHSLITAHGNSTEGRLRLLKTIGILNLFSNLPGIGASEELLNLALNTAYERTRTDLKRSLDELVKENIVLYRKYAGEYRLWEGTDFDFERELVEARARVSIRSISKTLEQVSPQASIVPAGHSFRHGIIREFSVRWCSDEDIAELSAQPLHQEDGVVWLMLGNGPVPELIKDIQKEDLPVVFGYSDCLEQVKALLIESAATREICSAPQLERDGVGRREAVFRAYRAEKELRAFLEKTFMPGSASVEWYVRGQKVTVSNRRHLSKTLSDLCDAVFHLSPRINNEMLNVDRLSSTAAAARNRVAEALAIASPRKDLGLEGFGPEVAIYRSVFKDTGLHGCDTDGNWKLLPPDPRTQREFAAVWAQIDKLLQEAESIQSFLSAKTVIESLKKPPFGLREGPAPLLLVHYLLVKADEVAVYEEEVFKPFFGDADAVLLMRRPELFKLRSYRMTGLRTEVVRTYAQAWTQAVQSNLSIKENVRNQTLLSIVVPLTEFIKALPQYTQNTRNLSANALRLRNALFNAKDPQELLFAEIPEALGFNAFELDSPPSVRHEEVRDFPKVLSAAVNEMSNAFPRFVEKAKYQLARAFDKTVPPAEDFGRVRQTIAERASNLINYSADQEMKPLLKAFSSDKESDEEWVSKIAVLLLNKPLSDWQEGDLPPFALKLQDVFERIRRLDSIVSRMKEQPECEGRASYVWMVGSDGGVIEKTLVANPEAEYDLRQIFGELKSKGREYRLTLLSWLLKNLEEEPSPL